MHKSQTKRALLTSVLALVLCVAMFASSTYAWFTDTASTGINKITSGNLDVELKYSKDLENWANAEKATDIFSASKWEPGYTEVVYFKVTNAGSLAFKYYVTTKIEAETAGLNQKGESFKLSDYLQFGIVETTKAFADRDAARAAITAPSKFGAIQTAEASLTAEENANSATFAMVVWMPEETGDVANHNGINIPEINFGVSVVATQKDSEKDSYDNTYDQLAKWPIIFTGEEGLEAALTQSEEAKIVLNGDAELSKVVNIAGKKAIDLNGYTLTVAEQKGITVDDNTTLIIDNGTVAYTGDDSAPIYVQSNSVVNIEDGVVFDITSEAELNKWGMAAAIYVNQGSGSTVNINGGLINLNGVYATGVYANYAGGGNFTVNLNGGVINVNGTEAIGLEVLSTNTLNLNGGVINVKGTDAVAFNVGQSQGKPTVVTGNGQTVVNLYDGNVICTSGDAAQFEGVAMTVNQAKVLGGEGVTEEEVKEELDKIIEENDSALVELPKGDYTLPSVSGKDVTIVGDKDTVIDTTAGMPVSTGAKLTFKGVTLEFKDATDYQGFTHSEGVVFEDCVINGTMFLYSNTEFINCTFNANGNYNVWTYGSNVTFTGCTFNTQGRAILVYNSGEMHATVEVTDCTFNATATYSSPKAAIEVGSSEYSTATTYEIIINNSTADANHFFSNKSTSNLWGNKNSMDQAHLNVVLDGVDVY